MFTPKKTLGFIVWCPIRQHIPRGAVLYSPNTKVNKAFSMAKGMAKTNNSKKEFETPFKRRKTGILDFQRRFTEQWGNLDARLLSTQRYFPSERKFTQKGIAPP